jgi:N-formylglutamate amidohydrolase
LTCFDTASIPGQLEVMAESGPMAGKAEADLAGRCGGLVPGAAGQPAFTLSLPDTAPAPVLIAVPHAGRVYPPEFSQSMRSKEAATLRLEDRFVDLVAIRVARETGAGLLVAHAPRAMIDLNRAPDDVDWDMVAGAEPERRARLAAGRRARSGLGLVPRRLPGLGELWRRRMTDAELRERIDQVHQPYHAALAEALEALRDRWGAALLIDLHSMPPLGSKRGPEPAPDFVIGDRFGASCDTALSAAALDHFAAAGCRAAHNRPYAGGYVLERHASPARGIHTLQLEICRSAYLDASLREPGPGLVAVSRTLSLLVRRMAGELAAGRNLAQAAE